MAVLSPVVLDYTLNEALGLKIKLPTIILPLAENKSIQINLPDTQT